MGSPLIWLCLAGSVAAALAYLWMLGKPESMPRTVIKTAAVGCLALAALASGGPPWLAAALVLSAVGDALLAREGDRRFIAGLASFLLAHLAYAWLFGGRAHGAPEGSELAVMALILLAALVAGVVLVRHAGALRVPVAVYAAAIAAMGMTSVLPGGWTLAGAVMFMASDTLLGLEKFVLPPQSPARRLTAPGVWLLYYLGQAAIGFGIVTG
ncbi:lysoplasmalogenase [Hoeflea marina]|nr:lysoplasmalogenase [Hoeflea marina]